MPELPEVPELELPGMVPGLPPPEVLPLSAPLPPVPVAPDEPDMPLLLPVLPEPELPFGRPDIELHAASVMTQAAKAIRVYINFLQKDKGCSPCLLRQEIACLRIDRKPNSAKVPGRRLTKSIIPINANPGNFLARACRPLATGTTSR